MRNHSQICGVAALGLALLAFQPIAAQADVTIQRTTHFSEVTGITAHDSTTTDYIQGDKKREENLRKFTGAVLGAWQRFRGEDKGSLSVDIELIGANKHYELDPQKKTYSVESLYDPSQPTSENSRNGGQAQQQPQQQQNKDVKVTKNEFKVQATGKKQNFNGFDTAEYLVTWDVETENAKTGEKSKSLMTADLWNSTDPRLASAHAEEAAYDRAYRKLMHLPGENDESQQFGFNTVSLSAADQKAFFDKLHSIKGYSVSTDVKWEVAGTDKNGKSENNENQQQSGSTVDSAIGSLFGSKSTSDDHKQANNDGMTTIFSSHVEIKSVKTGALDKALFELPKDYKLDD